MLPPAQLHVFSIFLLLDVRGLECCIHTSARTHKRFQMESIVQSHFCFKLELVSRGNHNWWRAIYLHVKTACRPCPISSIPNNGINSVTQSVPTGTRKHFHTHRKLATNHPKTSSFLRKNVQTWVLRTQATAPPPPAPAIPSASPAPVGSSRRVLWSSSLKKATLCAARSGTQVSAHRINRAIYVVPLRCCLFFPS